MAWRHIGYMMVLYLAGLKAVDPSLREAAAIDGCNEWQAFRRVVFPSLKPINVVVVVITVIEALRAYDIVAALNEPRGTEVMGTLVTDSLLGEGGGRVGVGSAYGMVLFVLCIGFIIWYVVQQLPRGVAVVTDRRRRRRSTHRRGRRPPADVVDGPRSRAMRGPAARRS